VVESLAKAVLELLRANANLDPGKGTTCTSAVKKMPSISGITNPQVHQQKSPQFLVGFNSPKNPEKNCVTEMIPPQKKPKKPMPMSLK